MVMQHGLTLTPPSLARRLYRNTRNIVRVALCHFDSFDGSQDKLREKSAKRSEAQPKNLVLKARSLR